MRQNIRAIMVFFLVIPLCFSWTETIRSPAPKDFLVLRVFPGAEDFAFFAEKDGKIWVSIGKGTDLAGPYDRADSGCWSPDGLTFAYTAVADRRGLSFMGAKVLGSYMADGIRAFAWPAGYSSPLYTVRENGISYIYVEGNREGPFSDVTYSRRPDSRQLSLYGSLKGQKGTYLYAHGTKLGPFGGVMDATWSADGKVLAYVELADSKDSMRSTVVVEGKRFGPTYPVDRLYFSPNGGSIAYEVGQYVAGHDSIPSTVIRTLWLNGQQLPDGADVYHLPIWSPDGSILAYVLKEGEAEYLIAGDRKYGPYKNMYGIALTNGGKVAYSTEESDGWYVHDGAVKYGPYLSHASPLEYSPDGSTLAAAIWDGKMESLYVGGKKIGSYAKLINDLSWSPDGKIISFRADGPGLVLYVGGKAFSGFHNLYTYWWSDDGSALEYFTVLIMTDKDRNFTKVFYGGKMYTGGILGNHVVYVDGDSFVQEKPAK